VSVTVTANTRVYGLHVILEELRDSVWVVIASHEPPMYRALIQQMGGDGNTFTASNFYTYEQSVTLSASGAWTGGARAFRVRCRASARLRRSTATTPGLPELPHHVDWRLRLRHPITLRENPSTA
jgi:hypothetical protein